MSSLSLPVPGKKRGMSQTETTTPLEASTKKLTASYSQIPDAVFEEEAEKNDEEYPFDFEKYYESREVQREPMHELVRVAGDSLVVSAPTRPHRTANAPPPLWKEGKTVYIDDCIAFYMKKQWTRIQRKYFPAPHAIAESMQPGMLVEMYQHDRTDSETNNNGGLMFRVKTGDQGHSYMLEGSGGPDDPDPLFTDYLGMPFSHYMIVATNNV